MVFLCTNMSSLSLSVSEDIRYNTDKSIVVFCRYKPPPPPYIFIFCLALLTPHMLRSALSRARLGKNALATRALSSAPPRDWSSAPPLVIRGGTVVNHDGMFKADVLTVEGKIAKVGYVPDGDVPEGARTIDATNRYVIPGGIDTHTHLEMPFMGTTTIDDYHYGTTAAVAGGTTLLMDFVIPARTTASSTRTRSGRAERHQRSTATLPFTWP